MFTSIVHLERSLHAEHAIAHDLRAYVRQEEGRLEQLRKIADDFEEHSQQALDDPERYVSNPINSYLLIKKLSLDWNRIVDNYILGNTSAEFLATVSDKTCNFPDEEDFKGAAVGLHRLQDTYALATNSLAEGKLESYTKNHAAATMTADDCFELGRVAYNNNDHYHAILWMTEALEILNKEVNETTDRGALLDYLSFSLYQKGNVYHAHNLTVQWLEIEPNHARAKANLQHYERMLAEERRALKGDDGSEAAAKEVSSGVPEIKNWKVPADDYRGSEAFLSYERLCRGVPSKNYKYAGKLQCHYKRHHPIFYLAPALEEQVNRNPNMYFYHKVLTKKEIAKIKELSYPKLHRSGVFTLNKEDSSYTRYRTSKSAWIKDAEDPLILRASIKTEAIANLTRETVEDLQVLNYGIGGHYEPHYDFARETELSPFTEAQGNRIATTMFYMSDVEAGGCTVFPEVGVRVCPEEGSMALWYNLHLNGEGDYNTRHAACPVLSGNKWVATKWYHARGNEFTRKCSLKPNE